MQAHPKSQQRGQTGGASDNRLAVQRPDCRGHKSILKGLFAANIYFNRQIIRMII